MSGEAKTEPEPRRQTKRDRNRAAWAIHHQIRAEWAQRWAERHATLRAVKAEYFNTPGATWPGWAKLKREIKESWWQEDGLTLGYDELRKEGRSIEGEAARAEAWQRGWMIVAFRLNAKLGRQARRMGWE